MNKIEKAKEQYQNIEIPEQLEFMVKNTLRKEEKKMKRKQIIGKTLGIAAAIAILLTGTVNISPAAAESLSKVPLLGGLVKIVTIRDFQHQEEGFEAEVKVPAVEGLDPSLENSLNQKYLAEGEGLYKDFLKKMGDQKEINAENLAIFGNYNVLTDDSQLLVIQRVTTEIQASGSESAVYDNIDKIGKRIITLPSLFKDDSYVSLISEEILRQMKEQMASDTGKTYFLDKDTGDAFKEIAPNQSFYINAQHKLVIHFDEYTVAPGSMGMVEFVIPTPVIEPLLVGNQIIQ